MNVNINKFGVKFFAFLSGAVIAASSLYAGQNLIENGGFESSGDIGSAGYKKICDGANLGAWKALRTYNVGLVNVQKAESWRLNQNVRGEAGKYVVYMQVAGDAGDLSLYQDVAIPEAGLYRFSAKAVARSNGYNGNVYSYSLGGTRLYKGSTTDGTYWQKFVRVVRITSPGVYRVEVKCYCADRDQMTMFDDFVLEKCEITDGAPETPALIHRYSFNGSWNNSVDGAPAAIPVGTVQLDENNKTCTLLNQSVNQETGEVTTNTDYISFGADFLPVNGQATLEFWFTENTAQIWSRLFTYGSGTEDVITFVLRTSKATGAPSIQVSSFANSGSNVSGSMPALESGKQYYAAVVITPVQTEQGGTRVTAYLYDASTKAFLGKASVDTRHFLMKDFSRKNFFIGKSHIWPDLDSKMSVDEFRAWNVAFSEEMIGASVAAGPDAEQLPNPQNAVSVPEENVWEGESTVIVEDSVRGLSGTGAGTYTISSESQTFTAPASVTDDMGRTWAPSGYKLERYDAQSARWLIEKTGAETAVVCEKQSKVGACASYLAVENDRRRSCL